MLARFRDSGLKVLILLSTLLLFIFMLGGCGNQDADIDTDIDIIEDIADAIPGRNVVTDDYVTLDNISEFVLLGQYKGIEYDATVLVVTDEDVEDWITNHLSHAMESVSITDRAVMDGDIVIIDFEGFRDGAPFEGGAGENVRLEIGAGQFIPGFEEQIIGRYAGEEFYIDITFPEVYHAEDLAGQDAVFWINLTGVYIEVLPELTDEFVQDELGLESVEEYRYLVRSQLERQAENSARGQVWSTIVNNSTVLKFPRSEIEYMMARDIRALEGHAEANNLDLETLINAISGGMGVDEFIDLEVRPAAFQDVTQDLVLRAVAAAEGIVITDEEFNEAVASFVEQFDYESVEEFLEINGSHAVRITLLAERVIEVIMAYAIER